MKLTKALILISLGVLVILFFLLDSRFFFELDYIKSQQAVLNSYYTSHPYKTIAIYFLMYVLLTGLSLPVAGILMIACGAIFGLISGIIIASFASAVGATLAFLTSRYLLHDFIQRRYSDKLKTVNKGIKTDGVLYLFLLRQTSIIPSFMLNILMGLTPISTSKFYIATQTGMLAVTVIFVNAGTQLATINEPSEILSLRVMVSFLLLGLFPLLTKKTIVYIRKLRSKHHYSEDPAAE